MTNNNYRRLLVGVNEVCTYLQCCEQVFYKFIRLGMPAKLIDGRWYAHAENIDTFFRTLTNINSSKTENLEENPLDESECQP
jgi:hypothetical protein